MSVKIVEEPMEWPRGMERCCICRVNTAWWTAAPRTGRIDGKSVALCPGCAAVATRVDIPTKEQWVRREQIATRQGKTP